MRLIEVASYPKSGNTWLRYLIANTFDIDVHKGVPDYHQWGEKTKDLIQQVKIDGETYGFYKSHIPNLNAMNPEKILAIYRHPLDVFLSCLNYFYINKWEDKFIDNKIKSVDTIYESGEICFYFEQFLKDSGETYYSSLLGKLSNYYDYLYYLKSLDNVIMIKYEDLFEKKRDYFKSNLKNLLEKDVVVPEKLFGEVDNKTIGSGSNFYWKSKVGNYHSYLTNNQIEAYKSKYSKDLVRLGFEI
tara:strand:+ start:5582 stop:6313 length:732 start_codon:yes stop_codon:yes gene_type:complete